MTGNEKKYDYNGREISYGEYIRLIGDNIGSVRDRIQKVSGGRNVNILAATKTVPAEIINGAAKEYGLTLIGENKVQELVAKYPYLDKELLEIHFIGHLQTNKVKQIIDKVTMIHSLDTLPLAKEIGKRAVAAGKTMPVLIEINVAGEEEKSGVLPENAVAFAKEISGIPGISVKGLMTMAPAGIGSGEYKKYFSTVKDLSERIKAENIPGVGMERLSMGMSDSFAEAAECGADTVRLGSVIFGKRIYPPKDPGEDENRNTI